MNWSSSTDNVLRPEPMVEGGTVGIDMASAFEDEIDSWGVAMLLYLTVFVINFEELDIKYR